MNNIFKKDKVIVLDDKYSLTNDGGNGIQLVFKETRKKEKKDSKLLEEYEYTDSYYFTRINQALNKYVELTQNNFKDLEDLISKTDKVFAVIEEFNLRFKQW